ncbi:MAG: hypothetical protein IKJ55_07875 [Clostridia bacterium]|nr:hypothetical protein [Clostridia bacterium]
MKTDIQNSITIREDFFEKYYTVPEEHKQSKDTLLKDMYALGETCTDAMAFEEAFIKSGLSDKFNALLAKCIPKPIHMTAEQTQYSKQVAKELYKENGGNLAKDIAKDVADTIQVEAEEEVIARSRKAMIDADIYDDYTKATNVVEDTGLLLKFFKKKFGKKKDK